jgi:Ca2+-binding RTX toxin-like protein
MLDNKSFAHALPAEPEAIAAPGNATSEWAVVIETTDVAADDSTTATMAVGDTYVGDLEVVGDRDWIAVTLTAGDDYRVTMRGAFSGIGSLGDPLVNIYDSSGTLIATNDDLIAGQLGESLLDFTATYSGTYYIEAAAFDDAFAGTYQVELTTIIPETTDAPFNTGTPYTIAAGDIFAGNIEAVGDRDIISLTVETGHTYLIYMGGQGSSSGTLLLPSLILYDSAGTFIESNNWSGDYYDSYLVFTAPTTGNVLIGANGYNNAYAGTYELTVEEIPVETTDIPGDDTTTVAIAPGDILAGEISVVGDEDWYSFSGTAGQAVMFELLGDTSLDGSTLTIYDSEGGIVGQNFYTNETYDDAALGFAVATSGTYYIAVSDGAGTTGGYTLSATTYLPDAFEATPQELADYLTDGYWEDTGRTRHSFDTTSSNQITVNITALTADGQQLARWAFEAWEMVADVDFVEVAGAADITFDDIYAGAYASYNASGTTTTDAFVNISTDWLATYGTTLDSYSFNTYVHEIGHALGLGHQSNYNGSARYGVDEDFLNDSWLMSIMSYFSAYQNTYVIGDGRYPDNFLGGAMMADILAIQELYGAPGASGETAGDTTWGEGSSFTNYLGTIFDVVFDGGTSADHSGLGLTFTIYDSDGTDLLNLAASPSSQLIDLTPESFSSINGGRNNMAIASGTIIENVTTGGGNDTITGNDAANTILTGAGADSVLAGDGNDSVFGGNGTDVLMGEDGDDTLEGAGGDDTLLGGDGNDSLVGGIGVDSLDGGDGNDTLSGGADVGDTLLGGAGDDLIEVQDVAGSGFADGGSGNDTIATVDGFYAGDADGGADIDTFDASATANSGMYLDLAAGTHEDLVYGGLADLLNFENVIGTQQGDEITGSAAANDLDGQAGDDLIEGGLGSDTIFGDAGNDSLYGGDDADTMGGGIGNDFLAGQSGNDYIAGGGDNDTAYGGNGSDYIDGGTGDDLLAGNAGADSILGRDGSDTLLGGTENDTLYGNEGNDDLSGEDGDDSLLGGLGADTISGDDGADRIFGEGGNDEVDAGTGHDYVAGQSGDDSLYAGGGSDSVYGGSGNDTLDGSAGYDTVAGGTGNDLMYGGANDDYLLGEAGNDTGYGDDGDDYINGGDGADRLYGGDGNDEVIGGIGHDLMAGQSGDDSLYAGGGSDSVYGGSGNDTLDGSAGYDTVAGGTGNDLMYGGANDDYLLGEDGNDTGYGDDGDDYLNGGDGADRLYGGNGNDEVIGGTGHDYMAGQSGNDSLYAGGGSDSVYGGSGDDTLDGSAGYDTVAGGTGNDLMYGGDHDDYLLGEDGNDTGYGDAGDDYLSGADGADSLSGGDGQDSVYGGAGSDTLYGGSGDDVLDGGQTGDWLYGQSGNDTLDGGRGWDRLYGGGGADVFLFSEINAGENDTIADFADGTDLIEIAGGYAFGDLTITTVGSTAEIDVDGHTITVFGASAGDFSSADFIFS